MYFKQKGRTGLCSHNGVCHFAFLVLLVLTYIIAWEVAGQNVVADVASETVSPAAEQESQGFSSETLKKLVDVVRGYVDDKQIVGAELVVIKNRRSILHKAFGWKDRENKSPMMPNTLFNIRSMTKPVTGMAIQMLIDEGKLALDDPVSKYLPSFNNEKSGKITVEHLLTHRSGLPLTLLAGGLKEDSNIQEVAEQAGEHGPDFEPGTAFQYSDSGSDTLAAIIEKVAGVSIDTFINQKILTPLGMADSITLIDKNDPRTSRISNAYFGKKGEWTRYWKPSDKPIYPFAMGSQSLYSTPIDYARFLIFWMDGGKFGERQLLSPEAVKRSLTPVSDMVYLTTFPGLKVRYGQMWMLWMDSDADTEAKPVMFGHGGSDGTWAWAWPDRDLIVLYFTQSRGNTTGISLEREIDKLLINPGAETDVAETSEEYEAYLGTYVANFGPFRNAEFTVLEQSGHLAVDVPGQIVYELKPPDEEGKWYFALTNEVAVSFERDDAGNIIGMKMYQASHTLELPKGTAPQEPPLDLKAVQKYLGFYRDEQAGHNVEVLIHNGRLAFKTPAIPVPLELYPPDENGLWYLRLTPQVSVRFNEDEDGKIMSYTTYGPGGEVVRPRVEVEGKEKE